MTLMTDNLQSVTLDEEKDIKAGWVMEWPKIKLRDSRTSMILRPTLNSINQGIWLDIFPFDPAPPFANKQQEKIFSMSRELNLAALSPAWIKNALAQNTHFLLSRDELNNFINKPLHVRGALLDKFMRENFFDSVKTVRTLEQFLQKKIISYTMSDFDKIIYLPFEKIEIPAPASYDNVLKTNYRNWRELVKYPAHIRDFSADISSQEYFEMLSKTGPASVNEKFILPDGSKL